MSDTPSTNGEANGRDNRGRFVPGNPGGPGNPQAGAVGKHRAAFFAALRPDDVVMALEVLRNVMEKGKNGERLAAARELLDRVLGKAQETILMSKLAEIEQELGLESVGDE